MQLVWPRAYAHERMAQTSFSQADRELLRRISRAPGGKAWYKQLIRELGLGGGQERRLLREQLARLVARGGLRQMEGQMWAIPPKPDEGAPKPVTPGAHSEATFGQKGSSQGGPESSRALRSGRDRLRSGRLELHRDGYGFVRPEAGPSAQVKEPTGDIFIPPNALHGAMHGDLVLVDEDAPDREGRRSGRIARVLTRRNPTIVGIFHYGRPSGRRGQPRAGGRGEELRSELSGNFVQPWDERMGGPIEIPEGAETPPAVAESPHRTLGVEAWRGGTAEAPIPSGNDRQKGKETRIPFGKDIRNDEAEEQAVIASRWPLEGLAVEVEITQFPQPGRPARGRVVEVLGPPDAFGVDVEIVIRKHGIPHTFPAHVLAEAEARARETVASLPLAELERREDFRGLPIVTIDGETARDFDDAVLVRPLAGGHAELQVHIADVGWYVGAGSALDTEARVRGTSVYFPDRAVPMLPHALSSGMCSLLPHEDRLVLSCVMEIDAQGEIVGYRVAEGVIRSARRMTYTSVQRCLNASPRATAWNGGRGGVEEEGTSPLVAGPDETQVPLGNDRKKGNSQSKREAVITPEPTAEDRGERERIGLEQPELPEAFDRMLELALRLNRKRVRRGSIDFDLPEPVVEFDPDGNMKAIVRSERGWAHRLIEEFMLSANECVATWLTAEGIPSIYRIHEMPDPKRIVEFEETAAGFGQTLGIGTLPVKRLTMKGDRREVQRRAGRGRGAAPVPAQEIPERIPVTPQMYQRLVRRIAGKPEERILAYLMLRSLKQARYAEKNEGHFALASPCYTHFTSPIRRYPDLIVHRLLRAMLRHGADGRGGAIRSNDPQPWAETGSGARAQGPGARVQGAGVKAQRVQASLKTPEERRPKRVGRIGWTDGTDGENSRFPSGITDQEAPTKAAGDDLDPVPDAAGTGSAGEPLSAEELTDIAMESSQAERRAADAERELIEWKKLKFMADKVGDDFGAIILSVTKFGFFVELDELFIEGLVPLGSLAGDFYSFRDTDRTICGARTGYCFHMGDRVQVLLDRIDRQQRRLQFALLPGTEPAVRAGEAGVRAGKSEAKKARAEARKMAKQVVEQVNTAKKRKKRKP